MFFDFYSYKIFSLRKLAYCACNKKEKFYFDENLETLRIDVKKCGIKVLKFLSMKEKNTSNQRGKYKNIYTS